MILAQCLHLSLLCSDELHQRLVPGRSGEFADVCLDTVGAMLGVLIVLAIALICVQIKKKKASKPKKLVEENSQDEPKKKSTIYSKYRWTPK